eukprot:29120-Pelagococcus_subviridis.AAC.33
MSYCSGARRVLRERLRHLRGVSRNQHDLVPTVVHLEVHDASVPASRDAVLPLREHVELRRESAELGLVLIQHFEHALRVGDLRARDLRRVPRRRRRVHRLRDGAFVRVRVEVTQVFVPPIDLLARELHVREVGLVPLPLARALLAKVERSAHLRSNRLAAQTHGALRAIPYKNSSPVS